MSVADWEIDPPDEHEHTCERCGAPCDCNLCDGCWRETLSEERADSEENIYGR